jgi:hypothetical protein
MFGTLKTRTAVLMITAITVISAASAPLISSAAPTIRSVDRTDYQSQRNASQRSRRLHLGHG